VSHPSIVTDQHIDTATRLEWQARTYARGLRLGKHVSKKVGLGMEFNQFRSYVQGDDLRRLDWKMYAKTHDYFIRQSDVERNQQLQIIIDNSKSMDYQEKGTSKLDYAKLITATLTYIIAQQGDQFGWRSDDYTFVNSFGLHNWRRSLLDLDKLSSSNETSLPSGNAQNGMLLWITDGYMEHQTIDKFLLTQNNPNQEIVLFHLVGRQEEELAFDANSKFVDLETGEELQVNAKQYADTYQANLGEHFHQIKRSCMNQGVVYRKIYLQDDFSQVLRNFLADYNHLTQS